MFSFVRRCTRRFLCEWQAIKLYFRRILPGVLLGTLAGLIIIFFSLSHCDLYLRHLAFPLNFPVVLCFGWCAFFALLGGLLATVSICKGQLSAYNRLRMFCCLWINGILSAGWFFLLLMCRRCLGAVILIVFAVFFSTFSAVCVLKNSLPIFLITLFLDGWLLLNLFATCRVCFI